MTMTFANLLFHKLNLQLLQASNYCNMSEGSFVNYFISMIGPSILEFNLNESNDVNISIIDLSGRLIREVLHDHLQAGIHHISLQLNDLANGIYFVHINSGEENQMIKLSVE